MSTFVLVHGAWHDGSAWESVIKHLEAQGHQAFAPTIAGHGKGVNKNVNHAQCTQSVVDYIVNNNLTDIVLLGHSFGGTIIAKVAEAIGDRIKRLIFLDAFILNIALQVGFSSQSHLMQQFKRFTEMTPKQVRPSPFFSCGSKSNFFKAKIKINFVLPKVQLECDRVPQVDRKY